MGPDGYLKHIAQVQGRRCSIPVIASLNGVSTGGWIGYAKQMEQAGADALELNIYYIADRPDSPAQQVEQQYCRPGAAQ